MAELTNRPAGKPTGQLQSDTSDRRSVNAIIFDINEIISFVGKLFFYTGAPENFGRIWLKSQGHGQGLGWDVIV